MTVLTTQWQHPRFLIPQFVSSPLKVQQKLVQQWGLFCHWPLPTCKFTSPPTETLLMLSLGTSTNSEEWMPELALTYTYLPMPIILAWQTQRKANIGWRETANNEVCKELITNMTTTENMEIGWGVALILHSSTMWALNLSIKYFFLQFYCLNSCIYCIWSPKPTMN